MLIGRDRAQVGPMQALGPTACKIARTVYYKLKNRVQYRDIGAAAYEQKQKERDRRVSQDTVLARLASRKTGVV